MARSTLRTLGGSFSGFHAAPEFPRLTGSGEDDGKIVSRDGFGLTPAVFSRLRGGEPTHDLDHVVGDR